MDNKTKSEKFRGLSIAALVTGILTFSQLFIHLGPIVKKFMPSLTDNILVIPLTTINFMLFGLPIAALTCGIIDLKRIKAGRYSRKGRGFDIAGIVLVGIFILLALYIAIGQAVLPE